VLDKLPVGWTLRCNAAVFLTTCKRPVSCLLPFAMKKNVTDINRLYDGLQGGHVFKGVNMQVKPRQGASRTCLGGAGKTRPTRALLEFCQPGHGNIQIFDAEHGLSAPR